MINALKFGEPAEKSPVFGESNNQQKNLVQKFRLINLLHIDNQGHNSARNHYFSFRKKRISQKMNTIFLHSSGCHPVPDWIIYEMRASKSVDPRFWTA